MCFSEPVSFTAAAVLSAVSLASINLVKKNKALLLIACVPFIFALQQFSEGMIWHHLNQNQETAAIPGFAAHVFLVIAYLVWPIFIPLSLWIAESVIWRRYLLLLFIVLGTVWGFNLISFLQDVELIIKNEGGGIVYYIGYFSEYGSKLMKGAYLSLTIIPIFISSLRLVWLFGLLTLFSAILSSYLYDMTFVSVWCFFAAILSLALYQILKVNLPLRQ